MSRLLGNNTVLAIATRKDAVILVFRSQQGKALNDWMWKTTCVELCDVILPRLQDNPATTCLFTRLLQRFSFSSGLFLIWRVWLAKADVPNIY